MNTINFGINGAMGKMGLAIAKLSQGHKSLTLHAPIEYSQHPSMNTQHPLCQTVSIQDFNSCSTEIKGLIDFSTIEGLNNALSFCIKHKIPLVIGTTGYSSSFEEKIHTATSQIPILVSSNMSLGVNIFFSLIKKAADLFAQHDFNPEIIEAHHKHKVDAPSGTAKTMEEIILNSYHYNKSHSVYGRNGLLGARKPQELGIHSIRGGSIIGEHTSLFIGELEKLEISHQAFSRDVFAKGAIEALLFLYKQKPGLYNMKDVLGIDNG